MEGLVGASRVTPVRNHLRQKHLPFVPTSSLKFTKSLYRNRTRVGMNQHPKSPNPIAASIQPLEASALSRFDNTQPSKGNVIDWTWELVFASLVKLVWGNFWFIGAENLALQHEFIICGRKCGTIACSVTEILYGIYVQRLESSCLT